VQDALRYTRAASLRVAVTRAAIVAAVSHGALAVEKRSYRLQRNGKRVVVDGCRCRQCRDSTSAGVDVDCRSWSSPTSSVNRTAPPIAGSGDDRMRRAVGRMDAFHAKILPQKAMVCRSKVTPCTRQSLNVRPILLVLAGHEQHWQVDGRQHGGLA
jgi:hypothetical protein